MSLSLTDALLIPSTANYRAVDSNVRPSKSVTACE